MLFDPTVPGVYHWKSKPTAVNWDSFIGLQEFVVGYAKAPEQPQSSARPTCHSHTMMSMGREPATIRIAAYRSSPHCTTGDNLLLATFNTYSPKLGELYEPEMAWWNKYSIVYYVGGFC